MTTIGGIAHAAGDLVPDEVDLQAQSPLRFDKCNFLMALQYEVWYCSGQKSRLNGNIGGGGLFDIFEHRQPSGIVLLGGLLKGVHLMSCKCLFNSFSSTASAGIGDIAAARQSQDSSLTLTSFPGISTSTLENGGVEATSVVKVGLRGVEV
jgi:hypothetical protein